MAEFQSVTGGSDMSGPTSATVQRMDDAFLSQYYTSLASEKEISMNYLHQTVSWQITIFIGGTVAALSQPNFPNAISVAVLCLIAVSTCHFAVRCAKAYVNLIRWTLIDRRYLQFVKNTDDPDVGAYRASIYAAIEEYHVRWSCPLKRSVVLYKVFFELGFGFQVTTLVILLILSAPSVPGAEIAPLVVLTVGWLVIEAYCGFWSSPYFRHVVSDSGAERLR